MLVPRTPTAARMSRATYVNMSEKKYDATNLSSCKCCDTVVKMNYAHGGNNENFGGVANYTWSLI